MTEQLSFRKRVVAKLTSLFPNHQIYFRTDGKVRFFTLTTTMQLAAVSCVCLFSLWLGKSTFEYFAQHDRLQQSRMALNKMFGQVEALSDDMEGLEARILQRAARIEARQNALQTILKDGLIEPELLDIKGLTDDTFAGDGDETEDAEKALQEATLRLQRGDDQDPLAHFDSVFSMLEKRQKAFVIALREKAEDDTDEILNLLTQLGVNADTFMRNSAGSGGVGGPLVALANLTDDNEKDDPLTGLAEDWTMLKTLRGNLLSVPAVTPVDKFFISSKYGKRRDPFTKRWAHHSGTDLAAWYGSPVKATSDGKITYAGYKNGYGRVVEVDHGNGFVTRYGHLRKVVVKKNQAVTMGDKLGEVGSTGRSTGPHVHYEVWFDGKTLDPEKFIKASHNVLKIQGRTTRG